MRHMAVLRSNAARQEQGVNTLHAKVFRSLECTNSLRGDEAGKLRFPRSSPHKAVSPPSWDTPRRDSRLDRARRD